MAETWRLLDTGLGSAARNIALNRALLEARQADEIPSTLRFLRFTRSALLGCDQSALQAVNVDYCQLHDIALQRRLTGGPAFYVDEKHLGWELNVTEAFESEFDVEFREGDLSLSEERRFETALRDVATARLSHAVETFFAGRPTVLAPLAAHDFIAVVRLALQEPLLAGNPPDGHIVTR